MDKDDMMIVVLAETDARALIRAGELAEDVLRSAHLPVPDALSLSMGRLAWALECQELAA